jgi:hypothetical protein
LRTCNETGAPPDERLKSALLLAFLINIGGETVKLGCTELKFLHSFGAGVMSNRACVLNCAPKAFGDHPFRLASIPQNEIDSAAKEIMGRPSRPWHLPFSPSAIPDPAFHPLSSFFRQQLPPQARRFLIVRLI